VVTVPSVLDSSRQNKCIHHWLVGPPTYSHNGLVEETEWDCIQCGAHRLNVLLCPFYEVQNEWVEGLS
jgi:hypothetical protein